MQVDLDRQRAELALYTRDGEARHVSSGEWKNELRRMRSADAATAAPGAGKRRAGRISANSVKNNDEEAKRGS